MRTILAHLEVSTVLPSILRCSLLVGQRYGSYIEGFHMRPGQPDVVAAGADGFVAAAPDLVAGFEREARDRADRAVALFERFMEENELPRLSEASQPGLRADWRIETASGQAEIGSYGRVFDLIVVGRPLRDQVAPSVAALESALFDSGRPVLVTPEQSPGKIGEHVVIAWNGSTETARTVAFARPFIEQAEQITVITVERGSVPGPSGAELACSLKRNGFNVDQRELQIGEKSVGQAILDETTAIGGDLLVKGAYTQSRLRQMIFGGATSHILARAKVPVIMAN